MFLWMSMFDIVLKLLLVSELEYLVCSIQENLDETTIEEKLVEATSFS